MNVGLSLTPALSHPMGRENRRQAVRERGVVGIGIDERRCSLFMDRRVRARGLQPVGRVPRPGGSWFPMRRHKTVEAAHERWPFPHPGPLPSDGRGRIVVRLSAKEGWLELGETSAAVLSLIDVFPCPSRKT